MPDIPAEAVHLTPERVIEVAIGLYDGPRSGASAPRSMAMAVLANLAEHGFVLASPNACPSVAPESTQSPETPEVAPVYRPGVEHPAETLSALRGRYAAAIDRVLDQPNGYAYRGTLPDAVLAVRDDELSRALRIADYHADQHRQAADVLARLFPSIECVLIDHADELDDEQGRVDANLAELAYVYRELTGFDARTAAKEVSQ